MKTIPEQTRARSAILKTLLLILVLGGAVLLVQPHSLPSQIDYRLRGVWTTDNPAYAGRRLEIQGGIVIIRFGNDRAYIESVTGVEAEPHERQTRYTIHTVSYGSKFEPEDRHEADWRLDYDPSQDTIRLVHQGYVVWRRDKPNPTK